MTSSRHPFENAPSDGALAGTLRNPICQGRTHHPTWSVADNLEPRTGVRNAGDNTYRVLVCVIHIPCRLLDGRPQRHPPTEAKLPGGLRGDSDGPDHTHATPAAQCLYPDSCIVNATRARKRPQRGIQRCRVLFGLWAEHPGGANATASAFQS
jgi:hypothetical protein